MPGLRRITGKTTPRSSSATAPGGPTTTLQSPTASLSPAQALLYVWPLPCTAGHASLVCCRRARLPIRQLFTNMRGHAGLPKIRRTRSAKEVAPNPVGGKLVPARADPLRSPSSTATTQTLRPGPVQNTRARTRPSARDAPPPPWFLPSRAQ